MSHFGLAWRILAMLDVALRMVSVGWSACCDGLLGQRSSW